MDHVVLVVFTSEKNPSISEPTVQTHVVRGPAVNTNLGIFRI